VEADWVLLINEVGKLAPYIFLFCGPIEATSLVLDNSLLHELARCALVRTIQRNVFFLKLVSLQLQVFSSCLRSSGRTGIIASEEEDVPVAVEESYSGNYIVVFDPLDGSSNIDAAVSTGSIFGIYSPNDECLADIGDDSTVSPSIIDAITNR